MLNFGLENETIEFKKTTAEIEDGIISIVSMLNKNGVGTLYFGVKNNGDAIGQEIGQLTLRDISRKIAEQIKPTIYPSISLCKQNNKVIKVEFSGYDKPYSANGKFYIRVADEDRQLDIRELLKIINNVSNDNKIWEKLDSNHSIDEADEELLKEYISLSNKSGRLTHKYTSKKEILRKLDLVNGNHLNNAGYILFSKNKPLTIKLAVFATDQKLKYIDINRIDGNLLQLIDKTQKFILKNIKFKAEIIGMKRVEVPEIPLESIREVVINSFCHCTFNSSVDHSAYLTPTRIVVFNPGTFPNNYTPIDFANNGVESILRNPLIAKILYYANYIDHWASGFKRIFDNCEKSEIKTSYLMKDQGFEFTFYRKNNDYSLEDKIYAIISENEFIKIPEIAKLLNISKRNVSYCISNLKQQNKIARTNSKKTGKWILL